MQETLDYDVVILGAGPAGFTAGIYLARFKFNTLLLETLTGYTAGSEQVAGRSSVSGYYFNIPGFPEGIAREEYKWRGIQQARSLGCDYLIDEVQAIAKHRDHFEIQCQIRNLHTATLFFAMGVQDTWPDLPGLHRYVGRCLYWSAEANGYEASGKHAGVIGNDDHAALTAIRLKAFTDTVYLLTLGEDLQCSNTTKTLLQDFAIPIYQSPIKTVSGNEEILESVTLANQETLLVSILFFPHHPRIPRSHFAQQLGVHVDAAGFIQVNANFETNIPGVYAIGDITARGPEQVITSCFHGMQAAWTLHEARFQANLHHHITLPLPRGESRGER